MRMPRTRGALALSILALAAAALGAQQRPDPALVTVERIYGSRDFAGESFGPARWLDDSTYTAVEPSASGKGADLVRIDAATGRTSMLVSAALLTPAGRKDPLDPEEYEWSADHTKI